jgi:hypothetical protein
MGQNVQFIVPGVEWIHNEAAKRSVLVEACHVDTLGCRYGDVKIVEITNSVWEPADPLLQCLLVILLNYESLERVLGNSQVGLPEILQKLGQIESVLNREAG